MNNFLHSLLFRFYRFLFCFFSVFFFGGTHTHELKAFSFSERERRRENTARQKKKSEKKSINVLLSEHSCNFTTAVTCSKFSLYFRVLKQHWHYHLWPRHTCVYVRASYYWENSQLKIGKFLDLIIHLLAERGCIVGIFIYTTSGFLWEILSCKFCVYN
jgi:hypothetical protein